MVSSDVKSGQQASDPAIEQSQDQQNNVTEQKSVVQSCFDSPLPKEESETDVRIVDWSGLDDPENPFNWTKREKVILTAVALFTAFIVLINGTAITVAAENINEEFGISDATFPNSYWPVTSWTMGGALFGISILPLIEDFGLRSSYLIIYPIFVLFVVPQALAQNFATLIVVRFFAGGCVALLANLACSIICDVWVGDKGRTVPMSVFITVFLTGSTIGPVIGGAILQYLHWRWILYVQLIVYGSFFPVAVLFTKETRGPVILRARAKRIRAETGQKAFTREQLYGPPMMEVFKVSIMRPIHMIFTEPVTTAMTMWSGFAMGTVYLFTQSSGIVFMGLYDWPAYSTGYVQGAIVVGELLSWFLSIPQARLYFASATRNKISPGVPIPEARLYFSVIGGFLGMAGGMFVYAWTSYASFPWIAPAMGLAMVGFGINVVVMGIADYMTDAYSKYAASAVAAVAFGENIFASFLPLAAQSMYTTMGFQWASTLLGFFALMLAFAPVILLIWGPNIRARSPFMSKASYDLEEQIRA